MFIDARLSNTLAEAARSAENAQATGFDGVWLGETAHDPFLPLVLAAEHSRLALGTSAAIAFARSPMTMAYLAEDLQRYSGGRLTLGLGAQIDVHLARRFSMPHSRPLARMREYAAALRAIWDAWRTGDELDFDGDFYQHTLMTPMFSPGPTDIPPPRIHLAAVGPRMTALAGEIADGLLTHQFNTPRHLRDVTLVSLDAGLAAAGRKRGDVEVVAPVTVVTGATEEQFLAARKRECERIGFYGSTPEYNSVLSFHGWSDLAEDLHDLSLAGEWGQMSELIDDEVLDAFAVVGEPETIARRIRARYRGVADRVIIAGAGDGVAWTDIVADLRALDAQA